MSMWYNQNKYSNLYFAIISKAKHREHLSQQSEKHHVQPKSLGGSNEKSNIVDLTLREHFICHRLLLKMVSGNNKRKMTYALYRMQHYGKNKSSRIKASKSYELLREQFIKDLYASKAENKEEFVAKLKATLSTPESHQRKIEAALACSTPEVNAKKSISAKKRRWSDEVKKKMSDARKALYADPARKAEIVAKAMATRASDPIPGF